MLNWYLQQVQRLVGYDEREVAEAVSGVPGYAMPGKFDPGLESTQNFMPSALTYGMGCHAVEVDVDIETGNITPDRIYCKIEEWDHITSRIAR